MGKLLIFSIICAVIISVSLTVYFLTKKTNSTVTTTPNIKETTTTSQIITTTYNPNTTNSPMTTTTPISTKTENPNLLSIQYNQKNDYSINANVSTTASFTIGKVGINGTLKNISFLSTVNSTSLQSGSLPTYRLQIVSSDGSRIIFDSNIKIITWAIGSTFINIQMDSNDEHINFNDTIVLILNGKNFNLTNSVTVIKVIPDNSQITKKLITSGSYCTTCTESNNLNTNTYNLGQSGISGFLTDLTIIIDQSTFITDLNSPKTITIKVNSYTYTTELKKNLPQDVLGLSNFPNIPINFNDNFTLTLNGYDIKLTNTDIILKIYPNEAYTTPVGGNILKINFSNGSSLSSVNLISQEPKGLPGIYFISFNNFSCRDDDNTSIPFDYNIAFIPSSIQIEINTLNYDIDITYFGGANITKCTDTIKLTIPPSAYSNIFGYITSNSTNLLPSQATGMLISLS